MKKIIAIFVCVYLIACGEDWDAIARAEENEFWDDYYAERMEELNHVTNRNCSEYERLHNYKAKDYVIDNSLGIYVTDGLYISNWYRQADKFGIHGAIELYSVNDEVMEYNLIYKWQPMDTMFTTGYINRIKVYPHRRQEIAINLSTSHWYLTLTSIEVVNVHSPCWKNSKGEWKYETYTVITEPEYVPIWTGNITVDYDNDYIRRKCESGHGCDGYTGSGAGGTLCNDGWISGSTGSGTCSWHGGIAN